LPKQGIAIQIPLHSTVAYVGFVDLQILGLLRSCVLENSAFFGVNDHPKKVQLIIVPLIGALPSGYD
jgi:hypothetical protein